MKKTLLTIAISLLAILLMLGNDCQAQIVGGFYPNWYASSSMNNLQWTKMTDLFYAFAEPTNTGGYTLTNESWLTTLVTKGKANNVRVHLSFGGAAQGSTGWSTCISTATNRTNFANTCKNLVTTYDLNGINLDWEFPAGAEATNFADLAVKVRAALNQAEITLGHKVYLTCAVGPIIWNNDGINSTFLGVMDYVMPMAFDGGNCTYCGGPNSSSLTMAQNAFLHWTTGIPGSGVAGKGVAPSKIVIGIPFYENAGAAYNSFSSASPASYFSDADGYYGGYYYNSDPLIKAKADYLMPKSVAGLWTWELVQDRTDQYSLLGSMYTNVMSYSCAFSTPTLGVDQSICGQSSITLNSGIATATGRTFTWKKDGTIVVNASASATTYTITSAGTYRVEVTQGTCTKFDDVIISGTLPAVSLGGPYNLCNPISVTLNSGSDANGKTFVWKKDNVVITGATSPTYTASVAGTFNVTISASGCSNVSGSASVTSSLPIPKNDTLCSAGTANLSANIASDWFTASSGGTAVKTNSTTYTPSITANTTYYIQPYGAAATSYTTMRTAFQNDGWQQDPNVYATKFDALTSLTLDAVTVNLGGGDVKINIVASNGVTVVASKTFSAVSAGINTLSLGFSLSAGTYYINAVGAVSTALVDLTPATNYSIASVLTVYGEAYWDWSAPYGDGYVLSGDYGFFTNLKVTVGNTCGRQPIYAVIDVSNAKCISNPPVANFTTNKTTACTGEQITFTDASTGGTATSWSWNFGANATPATATGKGPITVTYSVTGTKTVALTSTNTYGSNTSTKTNYITVTGVAGAAGVITGNAAVCSGSIQTYSIAAVSGANTYTWVVPTGATIVSGQGTISISVNYSGASAGNLSVTPSNGCGNGSASTIAITVNPLPTAAGAITGNATVCSGSSNTYTVATVTNATGYNWTVPSGTTITSGLGTNSIIVTFGSASGNVSVIPSNTCGNGTSATAAITVNNIPSATISIVGKANVCPSQNNVFYSASTVAGATTYTWTIPSGASFVSGQGTTDIAVNFGSTGGAITVTPSNTCGSSGSASLAVSTSGTTLPFAEAFETAVPPASWTLVNADANITWASAATGANSTPASAFMNYWNYTATAKSDELIMPSISLNGQSTATLTFYHAYAWRDASGTTNDRGDSLEVFISSNCGSTWTSLWKKGRTTLSTLTSGAGQNTAFTPTSAQWIQNTISLNSYTGQNSILIKFVGRGYNGNNLYLDQINLTGSVAQVPLANFTPSTIATCTGQNVTFTDVSTNVPTSWSWNFGAGANPTTATGQGPHIVTYSTIGAKTVSLTATNSAGTNTKSLSTLVINTIPTVTGAIAGNTTVCTGVSQTYSVVAVAGANTYTWTIPSGATIVSGQGTNTITVNFSTAIVGNISVTPSNTCGNGTTASLNVTVTTVPTGTGIVSGVSNVCQNEQNVAYALSGITGASNYAWSVPAGTSIVSGNGTTSLVVNFTTGAGNISVVPSNSCGSMAAITKAVAITNGAGDAGAITGSTTICENKIGVVYSIASVSGAAGYIWTVPTGATIASGTNTNSITVNFGTTAGDITVTPTSTCGDGLPATTTIAMTTIPADAGVITGNSPVCSGTNNSYTLTSVSGATSYAWTVPSGASITSGVGANSVSVTLGTLSGNITVTPSNTCGNSTNSVFPIVVNTVPGNTGAISGATTICQNQSTTYSVATLENATTYTWTVPVGASITTGAGTNTITVLMGTTSGNVTVTASNTCGNALAASSLTINVTNGAANAGAITGITTVCQNEANISYSIVGVNGATGYTWNLPSGASIITGTNTNAITVNFATTSGNVNVTPTSSCGNGAPTSLEITVNAIPVIAEVIAGLTSVCEGTTQNYNIPTVTNATTYSWTVPTGATILTGATSNAILVDFTGSLSGQLTLTAFNGTCASNTVTTAITVNGALPQPGVFIQSTTAVCPNTNNVAYAVPTVSGAVSYQWTYTGIGATFSGTGNAVTANFAANATSGDVQVVAIGTCGNSAPQTVSVTIGTGGLTLLDNIIGNTIVCQNQTGLTYAITAVNGATGYSWTIPNGTTITGGNNTNTITLTAGATSGDITVTPYNNCETGNTKALALTVNAVPNASGIITGNTTICANQLGESYSITPVNGATGYTWTAPAGASIVSGNGSTVVSVNFGVNSGNITVTPTNACGNGTSNSLEITVNPLPGAAGTIAGTKSVCVNQTSLSYSITNVANASSYNWTIPTGATITAGDNTNSITVNMGTVSGNIAVTPVNSCGNGTVSTAAISVNPTITNTSAITGPLTVCANQTGASYSIAPITGATYVWTVPTGATITAGSTTNAITLTFGTSSGDVTVTPSNTCGTGQKSILTVAVNTAITPTVSITTPYMPICANTNTSFTAIPVNGGLSPTYSWKINNKPQNGNSTAIFTGTVKNGDVVKVTLTSNVTCASTATALGTLNITTVSTAPTKPVSFVTQTATVTQGQTGVAYSINTVANTNIYAWTYNGTGASFSNTNTVSTSVDYDINATSGNLSVTAINACGASTALTLPITVNPLITLLDIAKNTDAMYYQNGFLHVVNAMHTPLQFDIIDMNGVRVLHGNQVNALIDVSELPTAIYIARLKMNGQYYTLKFQK